MFIVSLFPQALLSYTEEEVESNGKTKIMSRRPELCIVYMKNEELSSDALDIHEYETKTCNDYHLECLPEDKFYFIVSPTDIVFARVG